MVDRTKRLEKIHEKGFTIYEAPENENPFWSEDISPNFSKIKVGARTLTDAVYDIGSYKKIDSRLGDKKEVLRAIHNNDYATMREISNFFFKTNGIYSRLCRYLAYMYRYDWMITPFVNGAESVKSDKVLKDFYAGLTYLDSTNIKKMCGEIALKVIQNGCYYGYKMNNSKKVILQELDPNYCRVRYFIDGKPVVEFCMKYFDDKFRSITQKMQILEIFPDEFKKGYILYKKGKLPADAPGETGGWYTLTPGAVVKFNINNEDYPFMISTIPAIIDLDAAIELDRKKMEQQLLKIIIQKMPIDKNGDLVFDVDEARELHNNAVCMLSKAIGLDVLTTFADVDVANMADNATLNASSDSVDNAKNTVYSMAGISSLQFNTDGNIALEKSILNDAASIDNLISQFEEFLNDCLEKFNRNPKKYCLKAQMLRTTIYNYQELSKLYKEQMQLGYSKFLAQIALGQSQSFVLANAYFENDVLDLINVFIPPLMSSTMNAEVLNNHGKGGTTSEGGDGTGDGEVGRPEKADDEKSEKTIANKESAN